MEVREDRGSQSDKCSDACRRAVALTSRLQRMSISRRLEKRQRHDGEVGAEGGEIKYFRDRTIIASVKQ